jgi:hypothetical protein
MHKDFRPLLGNLLKVHPTAVPVEIIKDMLCDIIKRTVAQLLQLAGNQFCLQAIQHEICLSGLNNVRGTAFHYKLHDAELSLSDSVNF